MSTFRILFCLIALSFTGQLHAQNIWNLEQCVTFALESNLDVRNQQLVQEQVLVNLEQSKWQRYPNLNSNLGHNYNFGRAIDPFTNQFVNQRIQSNSMSLSTSMILYNGRRITHSIERNELLLEKNNEDVAVIRNRVANNVALAYVNVIYAHQALRTAKAQDSANLAQQERVNKLVDAGRLARAERMNIEAQVASGKFDVQQADARLQSSYLNLKLLMQMDPALPLKIEIPKVDLIPRPAPDDFDLILQKALSELPEIKSAEQQIVASKLGEQMARAQGLPRLSVFANLNSVYAESRKEVFNPRPSIVEVGYVEGSNAAVYRNVLEYDTRTTPFGTQIRDNFGQSLGLSLGIPIYNNNQMKSDLAQAKILTAQSAIALERIGNTIRMDITTAYLNMQNAYLAYLAAVENEAAQRTGYEFSEIRFQNGTLTGNELAILRNNWQMAEIEKDRALYEWLFAKAQVEFYRTGQISIH